jgi:6-phosphofructokinase
LKEKKKRNLAKPENEKVPENQLVGDEVRILDALLKKGINQVYIIGGDGTHRGIEVLCEEMTRKGL